MAAPFQYFLQDKEHWTGEVMKVFALTAMAVAGLMWAGSRPAEAADIHFGFSPYGFSSSYYSPSWHRSYYHHPRRGHYDWHDTSHYDYVPPRVVPHGNHYHYVPGSYIWHQDGHWDYHRGGHHGHHGHHGHRGYRGHGHHGHHDDD